MVLGHVQSFPDPFLVYLSGTAGYVIWNIDVFVVYFAGKTGIRKSVCLLQALFAYMIDQFLAEDRLDEIFTVKLEFTKNSSGCQLSDTKFFLHQLLFFVGL